MKRVNFKYLLILTALAFGACGEGPLEEIGYRSSERAIEIFRVPGQVGQPEIIRTPDKAEINITVLSDKIDLSNVTPEIMVSIGARVVPASGETVDFAANGNELIYVVTSETGVRREWTVRIRPFTLPSWLGKTWMIRKPATSGGTLSNYTVTGTAAGQYPGQNPLGALTNHLDTKGYMTFIKTVDGVAKYTRPLSFYKFGSMLPSIMNEYDNTLTLTFTGLSEDASAVLGTVVFGAGADGKYADFPVVTDTDPKTEHVTTVDYGRLLRQFPLGEASFRFDLATSVFTFYDAAGNEFSKTSTRGTIIDNGGKTVTVERAFAYDEAAGTMQMRFQPQPQKLSGMYTEYDGKFSRIASTLPWVDLSIGGANPLMFYQLSGTEEVWYDFVLAE